MNLLGAVREVDHVGDCSADKDEAGGWEEALVFLDVEGDMGWSCVHPC